MLISDWSSDVCSAYLAEADAGADADLRLDAQDEPRQRTRRRAVVQRLRAGQVEKGLVDRERLHKRRHGAHELAALHNARPVQNRKSDVKGKMVSVRVNLSGRRTIKKKTKKQQH